MTVNTKLSFSYYPDTRGNGAENRSVKWSVSHGLAPQLSPEVLEPLMAAMSEAVRETHELMDARMRKLRDERDRYRAEKDWEAADRIKAMIETLGYKVSDNESGTTVMRDEPITMYLEATVR